MAARDDTTVGVERIDRSAGSMLGWLFGSFGGGSGTSADGARGADDKEDSSASAALEEGRAAAPEAAAAPAAEAGEPVGEHAAGGTAPAAADGADQPAVLAAAPEAVAASASPVAGAAGAAEPSAGAKPIAARAGAGSEDEDDALCYICFDGASDESGELLRELCACASTRVHRVCLEKMLNSRARRAHSLEERLTCQVCAQPYTLPIAAALVQAPPPPQPSLWTRAYRRYGAFLQMFLVFCAGFTLFLLLAMRAGGPLFAQLVWLCLVVLLIASCINNARARRVRAARAAADPQAYDDERFFREVVQPTREAARTRPLSETEAELAPSSAVIVHVGIGAPRSPRPAPAGAGEEPGEDLEAADAAGEGAAAAAAPAAPPEAGARADASPQAARIVQAAPASRRHAHIDVPPIAIFGR